MKVLVTGGAGFIGTNFVIEAVARGVEVVVLDALTYAGGRDNLAPLGQRVKLIVGDVGDKPTIAKAIEGCQWVVHFAAESHNTRSESAPDLFYRTNVDGTRVVLEAAERAGVEKMVHISTDEVYGSIVRGSCREDDKIIGDSQATSAYSKSKSLADDLAMARGAKGCPVMVMRPTNNFGPWQFPEKALPRWTTNLLLGQPIPLWGEGLQIRDWLFAPITAAAIFFLLENGVSGQAYNVAANHEPEITNRCLAEWLCDRLNVDRQKYLSFVPDPRPNHDFRYALDTTKITALGWRAPGDFSTQLAATVAWYRDHEPWWRKRKAEAERIYQ